MVLIAWKWDLHVRWPLFLLYKNSQLFHMESDEDKLYIKIVQLNMIYIFAIDNFLFNIILMPKKYSLYTKVVAFNATYNFVVDKFNILEHLNMEIFIFKLLNFEI